MCLALSFLLAALVHPLYAPALFQRVGTMKRVPQYEGMLHVLIILYFILTEPKIDGNHEMSMYVLSSLSSPSSPSKMRHPFP